MILKDWIKLSQQIPDIHEDVLLISIDDAGLPELVPNVYYLDEEGNFVSDSGYMIHESQEISHWFPVPKMPTL